MNTLDAGLLVMTGAGQLMWTAATRRLTDAYRAAGRTARSTTLRHASVAIDMLLATAVIIAAVQLTPLSARITAIMLTATVFLACMAIVYHPGLDMRAGHRDDAD